MKAKNHCSSCARGGNATLLDWLALVTLAIVAVAVVAPLCLASSTTNETLGTSEETNNGEQHDAFDSEEIEPVVAVLFPAFTLTIGVIIFYVLSRQYVTRHSMLGCTFCSEFCCFVNLTVRFCCPVVIHTCCKTS